MKIKSILISSAILGTLICAPSAWSSGWQAVTIVPPVAGAAKMALDQPKKAKALKEAKKAQAMQEAKAQQAAQAQQAAKGEALQSADVSEEIAAMPVAELPTMITTLTEAINKNPKDAQAYANRAQAYKRLGFAASAKADEDKARRLGLE